MDLAAVLGEIARDQLEAELPQDGSGRLPLEEEVKRGTDQFLPGNPPEAELLPEPARYRNEMLCLGVPLTDPDGENAVCLWGDKDNRPCRHADHGTGAPGARKDAVDSLELRLDTTGRPLVDITEEVGRFCAGRGDGLCSVFAPHATAGLALMEMGSGSEEDLLAALEALFPRDGRYFHRHGALGHGADHLVPAFLSPSLVLPVIGGRLALGTWQSVVLVDTNSDRPHRRVRVSFLAG